MGSPGNKSGEHTGMRHRPRAFYLTVSLSAAAELLESELVHISKRPIQSGSELFKRESMSILTQPASGAKSFPAGPFAAPGWILLLSLSVFTSLHTCA